MIKKLVGAYNRYHTRTCITMFVFVMLFSITVLGVNMLVNSSNKDSMETLLDHYGSYHCIIHDISQEITNRIQENDRLEKYGIVIHAGNYPINDSDYYVSIGSYDEDAMYLGRISLTEGSIPVSQDQICLEDRYRYVFDEPLKIGDSIQLGIEGEKVTFRISGFINDYSGYWDNVDEIIAGENDYPNALVTKQVAKKYRIADSILLYYSGVKSGIKFGELFNAVGIADYDSLVSNEQVYGSGFYILQEPIKRYTVIFSFLYLLLGTYILYMIQRMHLLSLSQEKGVFFGIGISNTDYLKVSFSVTVIPFAFGLMFGIVFYILFFKFFEEGLYFRYVFSNILYASLVIIAFALSFIAVVLLNLREKQATKQTKQYKFTSNYIIELYAVFTKRKIKRVLVLIILVGVILALFQCIDYDRKYGQFLEYEGDDYFITASASKGWRSIYVAGFSLDSTDSFYSYNDILKVKEELSKYEEVFFKYIFNGNKCIVIPETDSEYWNTLKDRSSYLAFVDTPNYIDPKKVPSIPDDISLTDCFVTFTVNENNVQTFKTLYPEIDIEKDLAPGKIVVFCEPVTIGTIQLEEDHLKAGDTIKLASVGYSGTYSEALNNYDTIQYYEEEYVISKVIRENYSYKDKYAEAGGYGLPVIIWTEETASMNRALNKIDSLTCYIDKKISDKDYDTVRRLFNRVALSSRNALVIESRFTEDFYERFYRIINISTVIILILVVLSVGYALYSMISIDMKEDRLNTAILRTIGIKKGSYYLMKILEYITYVLIGFLFSVLICILSLKLFSKSFYAIQPAVLLQYIMEITAVLFAVLILALVIAYISVISLYKIDIADAVRNSE